MFNLKKIIGILATVIVAIFLIGRVCASDVITEVDTDLETTVIETETEEVTTDSELETTIPDTPAEPTEPSEPSETPVVDTGMLDALKNTLNTVIEQSETAQTIYYIISAVSTIISVIVLNVIARKNKNHNMDITKVVSDKLGFLYNKQADDSLALMQETVKPVFDQVYKTQEAVVKAIALLCSNEKGSVVDALECLSTVLSNDSKNALENIKINLKALIQSNEEHRQQFEKDLATLVEKAEKEISGGKTFIQDLSKRIL